MIKTFYTYTIAALVFLNIAILSGSCKYETIAPSAYPDQKIYMSTADAANNGSGANGIYNINAVAVPGQVYRYTLDLTNRKFNVTLGLIRAGITLDGDVTVNVKTNTDTISKLILNGKFPANTQLLSASNYTLTNSVLMESGTYNVTFPLSIDLNFLLNNPNTKFGIAVGISTTQRAINPLLSTTLILIDTQFLIPTATFSSAADPSSSKIINFTNTSANGVSYTWDFGDGTTSNQKSPAHTYTAAGTYSVKLTTTGVTGSDQKVMSNSTITVI